MNYAKAKCPQCHRVQWFPLNNADLLVACRACGHRFALSIPAAPPTAAPPPPLLVQPIPVPPVVDADAPQDQSLSPGMIIGLSVAGGILVGAIVVGILLWPGRSRPAPPPAAAPWSFLPPAPVPVAVAPPPPPPKPPAATHPAPATAPAIQSYQATSRPVIEPTTLTGGRRILAVRPPPSSTLTDAELDDRIGKAINLGCDYLLAQFKAGVLPDAVQGEGEPAGRDALAVYALLQAAKATDRPDLAIDGAVTNSLLTGLAAMPMATNDTTYCRSLRAQALSVYNRPADHKTLVADAQWLFKAGRAGGYTYDPPTHTGNAKAVAGAYTADEENGNWDNSNSQYGALGVWAAEEAGVAVPSQYWGAVRKHWLRCQRADGQWGYTGMTGNDGRLSMTVAGLTMMLVAEDHLGVGSDVEDAGRPAYTATVARGLAWLSAGDHCVTLPGLYPNYCLYGLERAGLASGIKTFGSHDWYRELAARQVPAQAPDGSWGNVIDTAFNLLFLARGRHPILFDKLQFDGAWDNRPRDVAHLTDYAGRQLERPFNWQVVPLSAGWSNWMDAPVLFVASHRPPTLTDADLAQLRTYAENGGLIFTHADLSSTAFNAFVADLAAKLFPHYPLHDLPADDPVYRSLYPLNHTTPLPVLRGVSNGSRWLLLHSPVDLGKDWQLHEIARPVPFQVGLNVFMYGNGKAGYPNRLRTPYVPEPAVQPITTTTVARVVYAGDWNPEPAAAGRFARVFLNDTSIRVSVTDVDARALDARTTPLALLTGTGPVPLNPQQLLAIHRYVTDGGVLLLDACGGSAATRQDLLTHLLPTAFPEAPPTDLPADHPIVAGTLPCMTPFDPRLRPLAAELAGARNAPVQAVQVGRGLVLFSPVDLTTGLLGTHTWGVNGYTPEAAYALARNALLYALEQPVLP
jgi:hypothetical protein